MTISFLTLHLDGKLILTLDWVGVGKKKGKQIGKKIKLFKLKKENEKCQKTIKLIKSYSKLSKCFCLIVKTII